jgi:imidazolonepropionase-like amidohydrolase
MISRTAKLIALLWLSAPLMTQVSVRPQSPSLALIHVTVIDVTGAPARPDMTVIVTGDRIVGIGRANAVRVPNNAQVFDATGKFLIPGLWDMHVHLGSYEDGKKELHHLLAYGITGVRDMASPIDDILRLRQETSDRRIVGPHLVVAGPILQAPLPFRVPPLVRTVSDPNGAKNTVDELQGKGVDFIKIGDTLPRAVYLAIAEESTRRHVPFAGHLPVSVTASEASRYGQRSIEHFGSAGFHGVLIACSTQEAELSAYVQAALAAAMTGGDSPDTKVLQADFTTRLVESYDSRKAAALFSLFVKNGTWQVPTLVALRSVWDGKRGQMTAAEIAAGERVWQKDIEMLTAMRREGVRILAGTDVPIGDGVPSLHEELVMLVKAGMTPMEALQAATRNPADFLGRLSTEGTVETGKVANLVVLDANPLDDVANTRRVVAVILAGRLMLDSELRNIR